MKRSSSSWRIDILERLARAVPAADELLVAVGDAHPPSRDVDDHRGRAPFEGLFQLGVLVNSDRKRYAPAVVYSIYGIAVRAVSSGFERNLLSLKQAFVGNAAVG